MAVNKNFVVKNGLEVNSNLLVADLDTQTVGIGTTIAPHELHVVGGIGVTNLNVTGVATIANLRITGPSTFVGVTTFTDNVFVQKDLHVNGTINIDAGSGGSIGTDLHIQRHVRAGGIVTFSDSVFVGSGLGQSTGTSGQVLQVAGISSGAYIGGQVGIGTTNPAGGGAGDVALHVVGDSRFVGLTTFTGITTLQSDVSVQGSLKVTGDITYDEITGRNLNISGLATFQTLTAGRVALVGTGDTLTDDANLTFVKGGTQLVVGVGATVGGGLTVTGKTDLNSHVDVVGGIDADHVNTTGVSTFQGGSIDIANAIRHIGDPDTTIAFPSADTFKVETGGTDRLTIGPTGVATFSGALDINDAANISGDLTIADKVVHDGDTDTAIRFPAADTFTVETSGNERLRVTSGGNIAIGTITASDVLQVEGSAAVARFVGNRADALGPRLSLAKSRSADSGSSTIVQDGDEIGQIMFKGADGNDVDSTGAAIIGLVDGSPGSNDMPGALTFLTTNDGNNSPTERARIDSSGRLGIGTDNPGAQSSSANNLVVADFAGEGGITIKNGSDSSGNIFFADEAASAQGRIQYNHANDYLRFFTSGDNERFRITSAGLVGIGTATPRDSSTLDVDGGARFSGSVIVKDGGNAGAGVTIFDNGNVAVSGIATIGGTLIVRGEATFTTHARWSDNDKAIFGAGGDLQIYHNGTDSLIDNVGAGDLYIRNQVDDKDIIIQSDNGSGATATYIQCDGSTTAVDIMHGGNTRVSTTADGVDIGGTGSIKIPVGTTAQRNGSPTAGDFRYNSTLGQFEGYTDSWGEIGGSGGGGVTETDTSVSTTTATGVGSFAVATHRSASIIAQIDQGANYQVGRYLMIHDGTTATVIEESAIATGDMLGSFTADINNSNAELKVTMNSYGIATVTTKIDTVTV